MTSNVYRDEKDMDTDEWKLSNVPRKKIEFSDAEGRKVNLEARVSLLEKENEGVKCMLTSLPFVFAYGEDSAAAFSNFSRTLGDMYNLIHGYEPSPDGIASKVDGADYLRLKSFFSRVTDS
ncbi:hypothetical protein ACS3SW_07440 [Roseobacteraceae bacterium S113]